MKKVLSLILIVNICSSGCIGFGSFYDEPPIGTIFKLGNWEMINHFEKNADNNTEITLSTLRLGFESFSTINATIEEYWLEPADGSETIRLAASEGDTINHTYQGYGAFMARYGVIDSEGNEDTMPRSKYDWPALIRSAAYYMNESTVDEPADLYVDAPNENSVGSPKAIHIVSEITNFWGLPLISQPVDITWKLIDPNGEIVESHTETIQGGDDYTWEIWYCGYDDECTVERGAYQLIIESSGDVSLNQKTVFHMRYSGFMYNP